MGPRGSVVHSPLQRLQQRLWDSRFLPSFSAPIPGHSDWITSLQFVPGHPQLLCSSSLDDTIRLWDVHAEEERMECVALFPDEPDLMKVFCAPEAAGDSARLLALPAESAPKLYDITTQQLVMTFAPAVGYSSPGALGGGEEPSEHSPLTLATACGWCPAMGGTPWEHCFYVGVTDPAVSALNFYDTRLQSCILSWNVAMPGDLFSAVMDPSASGGGQRVWIALNGHLDWYDLRFPSLPQAALRRQAAPSSTAALLSEGQLSRVQSCKLAHPMDSMLPLDAGFMLCASAIGSQLTAIDPMTGRSIWEAAPHTFPRVDQDVCAVNMATGPSGRHVAVPSSEGLSVYDVLGAQDPIHLGRLPGESPMLQCAWSPMDEFLLATGSAAGSIWLWKLAPSP